MQRLPLPGPSALSHGAGAPPQATSDFMLRDILERWAGSDDTLRIVMLAKTEEDKLKQEVLRLEIRRTEMEMMKEALRAGIAPSLVPQIFMGSGNVSAYLASQAQMQGQAQAQAQAAAAQAQAQAHHMHAQQQQQQQNPTTSPTQRTFPPQQQQPLPSFKQQHRATQSLAAASPRTLSKQDPYSSQQGTPNRHTPSETILPGSASHAPGHIHQDHEGGSGSGSARESNAPSLFFHHWQPPQQQQAPSATAAAATANTADGDAASNAGTSESRGPTTSTAANAAVITANATSGAQQPNSPTPRKKRLTSAQVLNPISPGNAPSQLGRRSPSRGGGGSGHARHRSEASLLHTRFSEYLPPPPSSAPRGSTAPSSGGQQQQPTNTLGPLLPPGQGNGGTSGHQSSFMRSSERDLPPPQQQQQQQQQSSAGSAQEQDQARKRKRGTDPATAASGSLAAVEEQTASPSASSR